MVTAACFIIPLAEESSLVKIASIHAIKMPQLPPEPVGRCSNTLQVCIVAYMDVCNKHVLLRSFP